MLLELQQLITNHYMNYLLHCYQVMNLSVQVFKFLKSDSKLNIFRLWTKGTWGCQPGLWHFNFQTSSNIHGPNNWLINILYHTYDIQTYICSSTNHSVDMQDCTLTKSKILKYTVFTLVKCQNSTDHPSDGVFQTINSGPHLIGIFLLNTNATDNRSPEFNKDPTILAK